MIKQTEKNTGLGVTPVFPFEMPQTFVLSKKSKVMPTQIITSDDLREFKIELLEEIRHIFLSSQSVVNPENKRFLKSQEVMQLLNISASSLQTMRNSRILSFTRIQGTIYYDWNDIVKLMEQNKKQARTNMKFV